MIRNEDGVVLHHDTGCYRQLGITKQTRTEAREKAMEYICSFSCTEGLDKVFTFDWVNDHWHDFLEDSKACGF